MLVIFPTIQQATGRPFSDTAPLFEEEGDILFPTLPVNGINPGRLHGPCARTTFTTEKQLVNSG